MKETGERGEFFDTALSPFPYEDSLAFDYFDRDRELYNQSLYEISTGEE